MQLNILKYLKNKAIKWNKHFVLFYLQHKYDLLLQR
jgi:hypothetical protein